MKIPFDIAKRPQIESGEYKDYYDAIIAKLEITQDDALLTDNQINFLKSLRPQPNWKPNEEQMESLSFVKEYFRDLPSAKKEYISLVQLYSGLKELM